MEEDFPFLYEDKMYTLSVPLRIEEVGREFVDTSFYSNLEKYFRPPRQRRKDGFYVQGQKFIFSGLSDLEKNIATYVVLKNELLPEKLIDYIVLESFNMTLFDLHVARCLSTPSGRKFRAKYICFSEPDDGAEAQFLQEYLKGLLDVSE